jgi:hypothetical protein
MRGARSPPWLLLFRMLLTPCFFSPMCSRVLPPEKMVSVRSVMESECKPCATAVMVDVTGGRGRVGSRIAGGEQFTR